MQLYRSAEGAAPTKSRICSAGSNLALVVAYSSPQLAWWGFLSFPIRAGSPRLSIPMSRKPGETLRRRSGQAMGHSCSRGSF